jgi:hypothetical protein
MLQRKSVLLSMARIWPFTTVESSWNVMAHGDTREGKWRGNWRMEWVAIKLHTTSEHGVSSITTADAHTSTASSQLKWHARLFKWTRPFRQNMKSSFCTCAITFQTQSTTKLSEARRWSVYVVIFILCSVVCGLTATSLELPNVFPGDQSPCVKTKYRATDKRSSPVIANTTTIQVNVWNNLCLEDHGFRIKYGSLEW